MTTSAAPLKSLDPGLRLARHGHARAYATIVLDGGYAEFGETGAIEAGPGDVVIHACFCAHADRAGERGARLINLPLAGRPATGITRPGDLDDVLRLARRDPLAAGAMLAGASVLAANREEDWPDLLATRLREAAGLAGFAREIGIRPETLSRGFKARYGVSPQRFAHEARARRAWRAIVDTRELLGRIALETGFADQAHMTRAVRDLTGAPPGAWRRTPAPGA